MGMERQEEDIFDGQGVLIMSVEFATALGLTDMDPVGGTVAGTAEAAGFAEGFEQDGAEAVAMEPVVGEGAGGEGEQVGGEVRDAGPGQDQEAGVIDDEGEVAQAGGGVPADEAVTGAHFPGGGREAEQGEGEAAGGVDEVAQLGAGESGEPEVVVALDVFVPEEAAGIAGPQQIEVEGADVGEGAGQVERGGRIGGG